MPTTALAVTTELFRDWAGPLAGPALEVIHWYFREVSEQTDAVGVADAEKLAAQAQGAPSMSVGCSKANAQVGGPLAGHNLIRLP